MASPENPLSSVIVSSRKLPEEQELRSVIFVFSLTQIVLSLPLPNDLH